MYERETVRSPALDGSDQVVDLTQTHSTWLDNP